MSVSNKAWIISRALALAALAGISAGVGTAFALYSANSIFQGSADPMDALGFVFGAIGWLIAWGAWRLIRGRPGAWLVKWILVAIALGEPVIWAFFKSFTGMMMHA